jgi:ubiquinol-cytochrome c reductase iron-sulfur subunit
VARESLDQHRDKLRDPNSEVVEQQPGYAANETRSLRPEWLVVEGSCTHLGCVFKGVPAPTNLRVPPYRFVRDDLILIGQDSGVA